MDNDDYSESYAKTSYDHKENLITCGGGRSEDLNELFTALSMAQKTMPHAKTDSKNPFFGSDYADLATIVKTARPHLAENGLCTLETKKIIRGQRVLVTILGHTSGQWIESCSPINPPLKIVKLKAPKESR